jgi:hypothetical protein
MKLVLIHGRSQQERDPVQLQDEWMASLKDGLQRQGLDLPENVEVVFPFYGKRLYELEKNMSKDIKAKGEDSEDPKSLEFRALMGEELRKRAGVSDDQVNIEYGDNPKPRGPMNWEWVHAIFRALDKYVPGMSDGILDKFTNDVFLYMKKAGVRDEIDGIVAQAITTEPSVVVAHSLGTVVGYSVLRKDPRPLKVPLYLTLGSPLGVKAIRSGLSPLKFPKPVSDWYNAFDERDVIALYSLDFASFPVQPPIENNNTVLNDTENRHGISGYLKDPKVAKRIYEALV